MYYTCSNKTPLMSLATFCIYLAGCYLAYYGVVMLVDLLLHKRPGSSASTAIDYTLSAVPRQAAATIQVGLDDHPPSSTISAEAEDFEPMDNLTTDLRLETISDEGIEIAEGAPQALTSKPYNS